MDTALPPPLPELRGNIIAVDLLRACVAHNADDVRDLLSELDTGMRRLTDPAGGFALYNHTRYRAEEMFADALEGLGVRPDDVAGTMPSAAVAVEVASIMGRFGMPPYVADALRAFPDGDFGRISNLDGIDRMAAVSLATAAAERAAASPEAVLQKLDRLRAEHSS
ncbi:hypothetical protein ACFC26_41330 [Kitasatospora purpeofusca]|uniref:hypothetical protein n=1 Tax=Kitasatospora purpeofusca TaxID=67352 RepID=UPI0035DEDAD3